MDTHIRQLKIIFLQVLDYSQSNTDTNISKKKKKKNISRQHSFVSEEAKFGINEESLSDSLMWQVVLSICPKLVVVENRVKSNE